MNDIRIGDDSGYFLFVGVAEYGYWKAVGSFSEKQSIGVPQKQGREMTVSDDVGSDGLSFSYLVFFRLCEMSFEGFSLVGKTGDDVKVAALFWSSCPSCAASACKPPVRGKNSRVTSVIFMLGPESV